MFPGFGWPIFTPPANIDWLGYWNAFMGITTLSAVAPHFVKWFAPSGRR